MLRPLPRCTAIALLAALPALAVACRDQPSASLPAAAAPARTLELTPLQAAYQLLEDLYTAQVLRDLPADLRSMTGGRVDVDSIDRAADVRGVVRILVEQSRSQRSPSAISDTPPGSVDYRVFETSAAARRYFDRAEDIAVQRLHVQVQNRFPLPDSRYPTTCITFTFLLGTVSLEGAGCAVLVDTVEVQAAWLSPVDVSRGIEEGATLLSRLGVSHLEAVQAAAARRAATPPAQPVLRLGWLAATPVSGGSRAPFLHRMEELGYHRGQDFYLDYRFADHEPERLPTLAAELVADRVDQIVAVDGAAAQAARQATRTIPIVVSGSQDPVAEGLATSVAHPGGNVTGLLVQDPPEIYGKRLEILADAFPGLRRVAVIGADFDRPGWAELAGVARTRSVELVLVPLSSAAMVEDVDVALAAVSQSGAQAVLEFYGNVARWNRYMRFQAEQHVAFMYDGQNDAAGISYAGNPQARFGRGADFVDRIRRGASPVDLPFERPPSFLLLIDLTNARSWGLQIAPAVIAQADDIWDGGWLKR